MTKKEQTEQENLTPQELKAQANAILAAADQAETEQKEKAKNAPLDERPSPPCPRRRSSPPMRSSGTCWPRARRRASWTPAS